MSDDRQHPFRDCGVFEFDEEGREWPVCGDCGEALDDLSHNGFIPLGRMEGEHLPADHP